MNRLTLLQGDCIEQLRTLSDCSVQCCATSPPYWGLRDYGVDGQIGLESSPYEYVSKMVEVFREVRRVLRDDGTAWINLGSSYASYDDKNASQSRQFPRVPSCGNDGKALLDSSETDRVCPDCGGVLIACSQTHRGRNDCNSQLLEQCGLPPLQKAHDNGRLDCAKASSLASRPAVPDSTMPSSVPSDPGACDQAGMALEYRKEASTFSSCEQGCGHNSACISDTAPTCHPSTFRKLDTAHVCKACGYSTRMLPRFKAKDMIPIPWMVALALQADGWYLRTDIIWHKVNAMPESVTDRPTKAHEYIFLLSKRERYYYDSEAIKEPVTGNAHARGDGVNPKAKANGPNSRMAKERIPNGEASKPNASKWNVRPRQNESFSAAVKNLVSSRNKRSVWTVPSAPFKGAHFATFPPDLIKPCILAGCPIGGTVLDPFGGSGTTGAVAIELGRKAILIELNPEYCDLILQRTNVTPGLPL